MKDLSLGLLLLVDLLLSNDQVVLNALLQALLFAERLATVTMVEVNEIYCRNGYTIKISKMASMPVNVHGM